MRIEPKAKTIRAAVRTGTRPRRSAMRPMSGSIATYPSRKPETMGAAREMESGTGEPARAGTAETTVYVDGQDRQAKIYARDRLMAGDRVPGPAIVTEMDATTLILPDHYAEVDRVGSLLIRPVN